MQVKSTNWTILDTNTYELCTDIKTKPQTFIEVWGIYLRSICLSHYSNLRYDLVVRSQDVQMLDPLIFSLLFCGMRE